MILIHLYRDRKAKRVTLVATTATDLPNYRSILARPIIKIQAITNSSKNFYKHKW